MGDTNLQMEDPELRNGAFVDVMMLENVDTDSKAYGEEYFGPSFNLWKVASS